MKQKCEGCRALGPSGRGGSKCDLGYKIEVRSTPHPLLVLYRPAEECPKPTTYKQLFAAERRRR